MQKFEFLQQPLLGELAMSRKKERERERERKRRKNAIYIVNVHLPFPLHKLPYIVVYAVHYKTKCLTLRGLVLSFLILSNS